jgi:hypothetical protein
MLPGIILPGITLPGIALPGTLRHAVAQTESGTQTKPPFDPAAIFALAGVDPQAGATGRIGRVALQLRDFDFNGTRVDLADIEFNDVTYRAVYTAVEAGNGAAPPERAGATRKEKKNKAAARPDGTPTMQITGAGVSKVHFIIGAAALEKLMQGRIKDVSDLRLSLQNDRVRITGTRPAPIFGAVPFALEGRLEARAGDQLWLNNAQLSLGGAPVPEALTKSVLGGVNPIFVADFTRKWNFRTEIKTIVARNDKLDISGDLVFVPPPADGTNGGTANNSTANSTVPTPR